MTMQDAQAAYFSFMGESCHTDENKEISVIEANIAECKAMLEYAIDRTDKDDISFWRRMLQRAKVQRREILAT